MKDGIRFFWVDTCSIDKSSSAELSEAINSMWRWYTKSKVCYAYLNDVPAKTNKDFGDTTFKKSQWFTRGWTLQELLAPQNVVFFNSVWEDLGTKTSLASTISETTKIDEHYLLEAVQTATGLRHASIAEKMSWASRRTTKREEDIAYCLLGLFDINMPLLYGEGCKAFRRLQEEIMKQSDDQSIFAWNFTRREMKMAPACAKIPGGQLHHKRRNYGLLADHPSDFAGCGNIVRSTNCQPPKPYTITNRGLQVEFPIITFEHEQLARLNCRLANDYFTDLAIPLCLHDEDNHRACSSTKTIPVGGMVSGRPTSIYFKLYPDVAAARNDPKEHAQLIRGLPLDYSVLDVFPSQNYSPDIRTLAGCQPKTVDEAESKKMLILLTSHQLQHKMAFMTFYSRSPLFRDYVPSARILPDKINDSTDVKKLFIGWSSANLDALPLIQRLSSGYASARVLSHRLRGKRLTTIDIVLGSDKDIQPARFVEQIVRGLNAVHYRYMLFCSWLLQSRVSQAILLFTAYYLVCWHVIPFLFGNLYSYGSWSWSFHNRTVPMVAITLGMIWTATLLTQHLELDSELRTLFFSPNLAPREVHHLARR